jgi:single-strand DNA-binding protein
MVNRRVQNDAGEWVDDEPTPRNIKVYGTAATNLHDSAGRGDRISVQGQEKTEAWIDKETGEKRTKNVVEVSNRFGEVGLSLRYVAARIDRRPAAVATSQAG